MLLQWYSRGIHVVSGLVGVRLGVHVEVDVDHGGILRVGGRRGDFDHTSPGSGRESDRLLSGRCHLLRGGIAQWGRVREVLQWTSNWRRAAGDYLCLDFNGVMMDGLRGRRRAKF